MSGQGQGHAKRRREERADSIERYVGSRIRLRRRMLGLSQEYLAAELGVTYQQVQKYETGMSRLWASRLYRIARALDASVSSFFPPFGHDSAAQEEADAAAAIELLSSPEVVELSLAAMQVGDPQVRRTIVRLVRSIALTFEAAKRHG
jgi:transcriptional regulator with XRE-family HTH domain